MSEAAGDSSPIPAEQDTDEQFEGLMQALELYFHVTSCRNHTKEERTQAYMLARTAFMEFAYDEDADEATDADASDSADGPDVDAVAQAEPTIIGSSHLGIRGGEGTIGAMDRTLIDAPASFRDRTRVRYLDNALPKPGDKVH